MSVNALQIHTPFLTAPLRFFKKTLIEVKMYGSFQKLHFFRNYKPTVYTSKRQTSDWLFGKAKKASLLLQKLYLIGKNHQSGNGTQRNVRIPQCKIYFYTLSNHSSRLLMYFFEKKKKHEMFTSSTLPYIEYRIERTNYIFIYVSKYTRYRYVFNSVISKGDIW